MTQIKIQPISTYSTGIFDDSGAEIPAFDPTTDRLFVLNAQAVAVEVLDISDPSNPTKIGEIDASAFGGVANSVAVKNGIVAVAIEAETKTDNGKVLFFDSSSDFSQPVTELKEVPVGALPDMLTFNLDGTKLVVANEGEIDLDTGIDPEGSVSIIDLSNGVENATVATADFTAFNGRENDLRNQGVRIFPDTTASEDFEPEYIAISEDNTKAYVTLEENNAVAVVDLESATVEGILPLGLKNHNTGLANLTAYDFDNRPNINNGGADLVSSEGDTIQLGGFSGLYFDGYADNGNLKFITVPDRGPNGDSTGDDRPFILPNYQARVVMFELNPNTEEITITEQILLTREDGTTPITGLPNIPNIDERPVDASGNPVSNTLVGLESFPLFDGAVYDYLGADLEGIVKADNGSYWMVDEYRPAIYHFSSEGTLIDRFVPEGTTILANIVNPGANFALGDFGTETLPSEYLSRRGNRGFEGMALDTDTGILYAFIQTPLNNPNSSTGANSKVIRMLGIDPSTGEPVAEYVYLLEKPDIGNNVDKIGDAVYAGNGTFYVNERDSSMDSTAQKFIFEVNLIGATNLLAEDAPQIPVNKTLEMLTADELIALGIQPANKVKVTNLPSIGYLPTDKSEGLAILDDGSLAVLNDNDFGLVEGLTKVELGIIDFDTNSTALDPSDRDDGINIDNHPVYGMFMPDSIGTYTVNSVNYFVIANEGDDRGENERIKDLILDSTVFPNAEELQADENLGRLAVSTVDGDLDGDGDYDRLQSYGTRSFSIFDENGNLVYDSGADFETVIAQDLADFFNSDNDDNDSLESRSDAKGPEPEGITLGTIGDQTYAFIGLERISGVMVYNITDPFNPEFVQYVNNRNFVDENGEFIPTEIDGVTNPVTGDLGPEGLTFISAENSPNGIPLLVVANEVSGTTTIYEIKIAEVLGLTDVFLNGEEPDVRVEETNLGNLLADAHLDNTLKIDPTVDVALINSGGIRSSLDVGEILNFDLEEVSPFNNDLFLLTLTGAEFEQIVEHSVASYGDATIGPFPQISGFSFSFDPNQQAIAFNEDGTIATDGQRVQSLLVNDSEGNQIVLVRNGELVAENADIEIRLATLDFLANGGDDYPFPELGEDFVNTGISEQESASDYISTNYSTTPFNLADTPIEEDTRIQNLNFREDTVLEGIEPELPERVFGTAGDDYFDGAFPDENMFVGQEQILFTGSGDDVVDVSQVGSGNRIRTGTGDDIVFVGTNNRVITDSGNDIIFAGSGEGGNRINTGTGNDIIYLIEDQDAIPQNANLIRDFDPNFDKIAFGATDLSLDNKGNLWDYRQAGSDVEIFAFEQNIARLIDTTITDNNFIFA